MARLPTSLELLNQKGKELYDELKAKRGTIDGMYLTLLNHPDLAEKIGQLGTYLRFESPFPADVREVTILSIASYFKAGYEWVKHVPAAKQAGVSDEVVAAIHQGEKLDAFSPLYGLIQKLVPIVLKHQSVPLPLQDSLIKALGVGGLIELVILCGFYSMIAGVISSFDVSLPEGEKNPFAKE